jgi:hypothetical protein
MSEQTSSKYSFTNILAHWDNLLAGAEANRDDLPALELCRAQLEAALRDSREAHARRESQWAEAARSTAELRALLRLGRDLAAQLESGVTLLYGRRNPKLAEFGMKPLLRKRKPKAGPGCMVKGCPLEATATGK